MKRTAGRLVAAAVLLTASACGGTHSPLEDQLQGSWASPCQGSPSSIRTVMTYSGLDYRSVLVTYLNGTCSGSELGRKDDGSGGRLTVGSTVTVNLFSTPVTAYEVVDRGVSYTLHYVDTTAIPNRIYVGEFTVENDGSSPGKRPTTLSTTFYWIKL